MYMRFGSKERGQAMQKTKGPVYDTGPKYFLTLRRCSRFNRIDRAHPAADVHANQIQARLPLAAADTLLAVAVIA